MSGIRAVFFDFGGTLFSNLQIPVACMPVLVAAADRLGLEGGIAAIARAFVDATRDTNADYVKRPYYLHRDLFLDTARRLLVTLGLEDREDFPEWFYREQRAVMINGMELREDCLATLAALRSQGLSLSIVSNIDDDYLGPMVEHLGLRPYFDHLISSESARSCKPDQGIFRSALERTGCRPEEAVFVGDSRVHDIQGSQALGIRSVLITEQGGVSHLDDENFDVDPDHMIVELSELVELARTQFGGIQ